MICNKNQLKLLLLVTLDSRQRCHCVWPAELDNILSCGMDYFVIFLMLALLLSSNVTRLMVIPYSLTVFNLGPTVAGKVLL